MENYYDILGVSKSASADEIKRAYRKLAHKYHPDKGTGNEDMFKKVNAAYQVLSNPEKRAQYDRFGQTFEGAGGRGGAQGFGGFGGFDFSEFARSQGGSQGFGGFGDIFGDFFGEGGGSERGGDIGVDIEMDFLDSARETKRTISVERRAACTTCHGTGGKPGAKENTCSVCHGSGKVRRAMRTILGTVEQVSVCEACRGRGRTYEEKCPDCRGEGRVRRKEEISLTIPAGIDDGQAISVPGKGDVGEFGAPAGNLYVTVHIKKDPRFTRRGLDVLSEHHVALSQAVFGDSINIATVDGEMKIKVPAGTQSGEVFRIKHKGMPDIRSRARGHHLAKVVVDIPTSPDRKQKKLLKQLREVGL